MQSRVKVVLLAILLSFFLVPPIGANAAQIIDTSGGACLSTVTDATNVTETRTGNDCIIIFNNVATIGWTVPANILNNTIRILVVGGGGGGNGRTDGTGWVGGGGGGGDYIESTTAVVTPNKVDSVTVGGGGAWGSATANPSNGGSSAFVDNYTITAIGGGAGGGAQYSGSAATNQVNNAGANGGSGGGGGTYYGNGGSETGVGSGSSGGAANISCCSSGGGGGAGSAGGSAADVNTGGSAGQGLSNNISGIATFYAGGGAGVGKTTAGAATNGGVAFGTDAPANSGSGGGGGGVNTSVYSKQRAGNGGSGVVIIRYTLRTSPSSGLPITSNLVLDLQASSYSGSGSWLDASGNYYDAAPIGGVTYNSSDQSFSFDGTSGYMLIPDGPKFQYFNNTAFTINVLINPSSTSGNQRIFSRYNGGVVGNYYLQLASGVPFVEREANPYSLTGTSSVIAGNKYLLTYVYDGSYLKIYENGILDTQTAFPASVSSGTPVSPLIGASYTSSSPSNFYSGKIYAVNFYSSALTQAQIQQNYAYLLGSGSLGPTLSVPSNQIQYRSSGAITATVGNPGKVTFYVKGKRVPGCVNLTPVSKYENFTVTCNYKPSLHGNLQVTATYNPTISYFPQNLSAVQNFAVVARSGKR